MVGDDMPQSFIDHRLHRPQDDDEERYSRRQGDIHGHFSESGSGIRSRDTVGNRVDDELHQVDRDHRQKAEQDSDGRAACHQTRGDRPYKLKSSAYPQYVSWPRPWSFLCQAHSPCGRLSGRPGQVLHTIPPKSGGNIPKSVCVEGNTERKRAQLGDHVRYFEIAGITIQVESDLPITDTTFHPKFEKFRVEGPGDDTVVIRHHFGQLDTVAVCKDLDDAQEVYHRPPWVIYWTGESWVYKCVSALDQDGVPSQIAVFSRDHSDSDVYSGDFCNRVWLKGGLDSLTMFATDQVVVARLLADREGCILHSGGVAIDGQGFLFVGHSEAGKSTTMRLVSERLGSRAEILCDDRNIVRYWSRGFRGGPPGLYVHGTWSHGDVPEVSARSVPLRAILFLQQHEGNELVRLHDRGRIWQLLLATLVKPFTTSDWWNKQLNTLEMIAEGINCYWMLFDKSGAIVPELERLAK